MFLLATVVGSGIMADNLAGGNMAIALLGNTLATGAILAVLILIFGGISGAHFNPAVTIAFVLRREISPLDAFLYVTTQLTFAIVGVVLAHAMFSVELIQTASVVRETNGEVLGEFVATFALIATILGCLRWRPDAVPYAVGLVISAGYWYTSSTSFANPAVTVARTFTDTFSGIRPEDAWWFIGAQIVAALVVTPLFGWLNKGPEAEQA